MLFILFYYILSSKWELITISNNHYYLTYIQYAESKYTISCK